MKIRHYYSFDEKANNYMHSDNLDIDNWETLRTYEDGGPFSLERTRDGWVSNCENSVDYKDRAGEIVNIIRKMAGVKLLL